jgi:hypothetical protein
LINAFDASKILEKRCVGDVDEDPELGESRAHPQEWHTAPTVFKSPEWLADAAERLRVKRAEDGAKAERALQRKQQRRRRTRR